MTASDWMYRDLFGNPLRDWAVAGASAVVAITVIIVLRRFIVQRLAALAARTETLVDDALVELARSVSKIYVVVIVVSIAGMSLDFSSRLHYALRSTAVIFAALQAARSGTRIVSWWLEHYSERHGDLDRTTIGALGIAVKIGRLDHAGSRRNRKPWFRNQGRPHRTGHRRHRDCARAPEYFRRSLRRALDRARQAVHRRRHDRRR